MNKNTLVCTGCNSVVSLALSYDGLTGRCGCSSFGMSPGGDRPRTWDRLESVTEPQNFGYTRRVSGEDESVTELRCTRCNSDESVSVSLSEDGIRGRPIRAEIRCRNDHGLTNHDSMTVVYYSENSHRLGVLKRYQEASDD